MRVRTHLTRWSALGWTYASFVGLWVFHIRSDFSRFSYLIICRMPNRSAVVVPENRVQVMDGIAFMRSFIILCTGFVMTMADAIHMRILKKGGIKGSRQIAGFIGYRVFWSFQALLRNKFVLVWNLFAFRCRLVYEFGRTFMIALCD